MKRGNACGGKDPGQSCPVRGNVASPTEARIATATKLNRIAWLSANDASKRFDNMMHLFNQESLSECFHTLDGRKAVAADGITNNPSIHVNDSVLSLLPELGTMGSKWGGAGATRSPTS